VGSWRTRAIARLSLEEPDIFNPFAAPLLSGLMPAWIGTVHILPDKSDEYDLAAIIDNDVPADWLACWDGTIIANAAVKIVE